MVPDVLVIGDLNPDLLVTGKDLVPRFGQEERLASMSMTLGGSAAICAAGLARLGLDVALAATIGDDDVGRVALGALAKRGVDTAPVRTVAGARTGLTIHFVRDDGDRAMLTELGTIPELTVEDGVRALALGPRHVHVGSLYLLPALVRDGGALVEAAHRAGATVSIDTNYDPAGAFARPDWLTRADLLLPNEVEARGLAGQRSSGSSPTAGAAPSPASVEDVEAAAAALAADGALVVVKRGAAGALAVRGDERCEVAAPAVEAVDAIGAGDSFDAGMIAALLRGAPLRDALQLACACGALSTRAAGGVDGQPTLAEALA
jgi:ribokinase